jgi:DNA-binding transcriptional LysR family regulator
MFDSLFRRSGLSLDRLRAFLVVAEAGGIARAAPGNPVRQSQISRQIGELEQFFGAALFDRRGRGIVLTGAGTRLAVVVREALQGMTDVAAVPDEPVQVSLGAGDHLIHGWVIPRLPRLGATRARFTLAAMHGQEAIARLLDARLDFAILRGGDVPRGLRARGLGAVEYALYVPRRFVPKRRHVDAAALLARVPVAVQRGDPEIAGALDELMGQAGAAPALVCETFPQAQRAVLTGRFAAVLPTLARLELPRRTFHEVRVFGDPPMRVLLAWHPRLERQRPALAELVPALVDAFTLPAR